MTAMGMYSANMMFDQASAGSMDASASYTRHARATAAFRAIAILLDAIVLASIFVSISLVILGGLANFLVLAILIQLVVLLVFSRSTPKR